MVQFTESTRKGNGMVQFTGSTRKGNDEERASTTGSIARIESRSGRKSSAIKASRKSSVIKAEGVNFGIPSLHSAVAFTAENYGADSWKARILDFIHRKSVQTTLLCLLIADVLLIVAELVLHTVYPTKHTVLEQCVPCCPDSGSGMGGERELAGGTGEQYRYDEISCPAGYEYVPGEGPGEQRYYNTDYYVVHTWEVVIFGLTVTILT